jgi:hypothetical protein
VITKHYVLDTNVYLSAYKTYYAFEFVESFWKLLVPHAKTGRVVSIDRVKSELKDKDDPLYEWACNRCVEAFVSTKRPDVVDSVGKIMDWVYALPNRQAYKDEFARGADGWIVAYAKAAGHTVVTLETYDPLGKKKIKIPNVCKQFGVPYLDTFGMMRELGMRIG